MTATSTTEDEIESWAKNKQESYLEVSVLNSLTTFPMPYEKPDLNSIELKMERV